MGMDRTYRPTSGLDVLARRAANYVPRMQEKRRGLQERQLGMEQQALEQQRATKDREYQDWLRNIKETTYPIEEQLKHKKEMDELSLQEFTQKLSTPETPKVKTFSSAREVQNDFYNLHNYIPTDDELVAFAGYAYGPDRAVTINGLQNLTPEQVMAAMERNKNISLKGIGETPVTDRKTAPGPEAVTAPTEQDVYNESGFAPTIKPPGEISAPTSEVTQPAFMPELTYEQIIQKGIATGEILEDSLWKAKQNYVEKYEKQRKEQKAAADKIALQEKKDREATNKDIVDILVNQIKSGAKTRQEAEAEMRSRMTETDFLKNKLALTVKAPGEYSVDEARREIARIRDKEITQYMRSKVYASATAEERRILVKAKRLSLLQELEVLKALRAVLPEKISLEEYGIEEMEKKKGKRKAYQQNLLKRAAEIEAKYGGKEEDTKKSTWDTEENVDPLQKKVQDETNKILGR